MVENWIKLPFKNKSKKVDRPWALGEILIFLTCYCVAVINLYRDSEELDRSIVACIS